MAAEHDWLFTPQRAAIHRPTGTVVIADLHLGYAEARQRRGEAVPERRVTDILAPLQALLSQHGIRRLVIAGDLFEESCSDALLEEWLAWLEGAAVELVGLVPGNHDRRLSRRLARLALAQEGVELGRWRVVHGDRPLPGGLVVQGHIHPCLRWRGSVAAPCYLSSAEHLVLPAYSADAAGVNVLHDPRWQPYRCSAIVGEQVLDFGPLAELKKK